MTNNEDGRTPTSRLLNKPSGELEVLLDAQRKRRRAETSDCPRSVKDQRAFAIPEYSDGVHKRIGGIEDSESARGIKIESIFLERLHLIQACAIGLLFQVIP
jgi:hypothetical protein